MFTRPPVTPGARGEGPSHLPQGCNIKRLPRKPAAGLVPCDGPPDAPVPAGLRPVLGSRFVPSVCAGCCDESSLCIRGCFLVASSAVGLAFLWVVRPSAALGKVAVALYISQVSPVFLIIYHSMISTHLSPFFLPEMLKSTNTYCMQPAARGRG